MPVCHEGPVRRKRRGHRGIPWVIRGPDRRESGTQENKIKKPHRKNLGVALPAESLQLPCRTILTPRRRTGKTRCDIVQPRVYRFEGCQRERFERTSAAVWAVPIIREMPEPLRCPHGVGKGSATRCPNERGREHPLHTPSDRAVIGLPVRRTGQSRCAGNPSPRGSVSGGYNGKGP